MKDMNSFYLFFIQSSVPFTMTLKLLIPSFENITR